MLEALEDAGLQTDLPIELVAWTNEEGSRFAPGTMGSMAFSQGRIPPEWAGLRGVDGAGFADQLQATLAALPMAGMRGLGFPVAGYLELHIEQGPTLERERLPVGIVEGIQGTRWFEVVLTGQAAHAGTTALAYRHDPMAAAAAALGDLYRSIMPGNDAARFTVGRMAVAPGSVNAVPGSVSFSIDLRHPETGVLDMMERRITDRIERAAAEAGCQAQIRRIFDMPPASFPANLLDCLDRAARRLGLPVRRMVSGAFHDALFVNRVAPAAMIFVPCRDGLSHNEAEFVHPEHMIAGARMMLASTLGAVAMLASHGK